MRVIVNAVILAIELALIAGAAWLAWRQPMMFAALTAVMILAFGWWLEWARLAHEFTFYVEGRGISGRWRRVVMVVLASGETLVKALLAASAALLTFTGLSADRLMLAAGLFAAVTFLGTSTLRRLSRSFNVRPTRWGYFRLAVPLGLLFSLGTQVLVGVGLIETKSLTEIAKALVFDLPEHPGLAQLSEFLFDVKQMLDALIRAFFAATRGAQLCDRDRRDYQPQCAERACNRHLCGCDRRCRAQARDGVVAGGPAVIRVSSGWCGHSGIGKVASRWERLRGKPEPNRDASCLSRAVFYFLLATIRFGRRGGRLFARLRGPSMHVLIETLSLVGIFGGANASSMTLADLARQLWCCQGLPGHFFLVQAPNDRSLRSTSLCRRILASANARHMPLAQANIAPMLVSIGNQK